MTAASVTTRASARRRWLEMPRARMAGSPKVLPAVLGLPVLLWQAVFFAAPLVFLVIVTFWQVKAFRLEPAFVLDNWSRILFSTTFQRALVHTIAVAGTTTLLATAFAFPAAYTIAFRLSARARDLAVAFLVVPVFSSYMLRIYAWQIVLSPEGIINAVVGAVGIGPLPLLGGAVSLQVGLLTLTLPIAVLILVFAMAGIDRTLIEAAENLGCRRARVIAHVILPSLRPAIALTATTSFLLAFGDYISPLFMTGSKPPTLSILIVDTVKSGSQWPRASVIGVSMLLMLALVLGLGQWLSRGRAARKEAAR
ncbi:ABC transporter permease [Ancylobacter amanitiformis]|uniref:ABC-type spermidine/putrescine transport system permease subunit I n=1 Tax=Ancylobacter amanitiformis TaxID=217069 RepID=A0ABU0LLT0_9HYPH|nr:ABC transporter permease [Ancylobacter amanitiformis]MDQ0509578.1 ABC-type spermidine/putrescine transport system permease subunit I [Ancylobacter amanitiformis]